MSTNPITSWIRSRMEVDSEREQQAEDEIASKAILAVKLRDQRLESHLVSGYYREDPRTRSFDHFYVAHSTLKAHTGGINSSHYAMDFYNKLGEAKRERLMKEYAEK